MKLADLCKPIRLILSDVDGVLTDGGIVFDNQGIETKQFHIRDGLGIKLWQRAGGQFGLVTGRSSHVVQVRASELGIDLVRQGFEDKLPAVLELLAERNQPPEEVCYIGDDLPDLAVIQRVGLGVAVADACKEVRDVADYVTEAAGGRGAVRELVELILKTQGAWDDVVAKYAGIQ